MVNPIVKNKEMIQKSLEKPFPYRAGAFLLFIGQVLLTVLYIPWSVISAFYFLGKTVVMVDKEYLNHTLKVLGNNLNNFKELAILGVSYAKHFFSIKKEALLPEKPSLPETPSMNLSVVKFHPRGPRLYCLSEYSRSNIERLIPVKFAIQQTNFIVENLTVEQIAAILKWLTALYFQDPGLLSGDNSRVEEMNDDESSASSSSSSPSGSESSLIGIRVDDPIPSPFYDGSSFELPSFNQNQQPESSESSASGSKSFLPLNALKEIPLLEVRLSNPNQQPALPPEAASSESSESLSSVSSLTGASVMHRNFPPSGHDSSFQLPSFNQMPNFVDSSDGSEDDSEDDSGDDSGETSLRGVSGINYVSNKSLIVPEGVHRLDQEKYRLVFPSMQVNSNESAQHAYTAEVANLDQKAANLDEMLPVDRKNFLDQAKAFWEGYASYNYHTKLVEKFTNSRSTLNKEILTKNTFLGKFLEINNLILEEKGNLKGRRSTKLQKLSGTVGCHPLVFGNPSNRRRIEGFDGCVVNVARHPCPISGYTNTRESSRAFNDSVSSVLAVVGTAFTSQQQFVQPSFLAYLEALKEEGKSYLYVNFQSIEPKPLLLSVAIDVEHLRTAALKGIERDNFFLMCQVMDGSFFENVPNNITTLDKSSVSGYLKDEILGDNSLHGYIPLGKIGLTKDQYEAIIEKHVGMVFDLFFDNEPLNREDKKQWSTFLLLFYTLQRLEMKIRLCGHNEYPLGAYLTACKDFQDRGNFCAALLDELLLLTLTDGLSSENLTSLIIHVLGVTLQSKQQGVIKERVDQGVPAIEKILALTEEKVKELKQSKFNGKPLSELNCSIEINREGDTQ